MCNTSQCELRSLRVNSGMLNVIRIVTCYTLPPLESPDSFWIAMAFSRQRPMVAYPQQSPQEPQFKAVNSSLYQNFLVVLDSQRYSNSGKRMQLLLYYYIDSSCLSISCLALPNPNRLRSSPL